MQLVESFYEPGRPTDLKTRFPTWGFKRMSEANPTDSIFGPISSPSIIRNASWFTERLAPGEAPDGWFFLDYEPLEYGSGSNTAAQNVTAENLTLQLCQNTKAALVGTPFANYQFGNYSVWPQGSDGRYVPSADATVQSLNAQFKSHPNGVVNFLMLEVYVQTGFTDEGDPDHVATFTAEAQNKIAAARAYDGNIPVMVFISPWVNGGASLVSAAWTQQMLQILLAIGPDYVCLWTGLNGPADFNIAWSENAAFWVGVKNFMSANPGGGGGFPPPPPPPPPPAAPTLGVPTVNCGGTVTVPVTGVPGAVVTLSVAPGSELYTGTVPAGGVVQITVPQLPNSTYHATATQANSNGTSAASNQINWAIDIVTYQATLTITPNPGAGVQASGVVTAGCGSISVQPGPTDANGQAKVTFVGTGGATIAATFSGSHCSGPFTVAASIHLPT